MDHGFNDLADWQQLGHVVTNARIAAGFRTAKAFALAIGVKDNRMYRLEAGRSVGRNVLAAVELGLAWPPGRAERVLDGTDTPRPPRKPSRRRWADDPELGTDTERELWRKLKMIKGLSHEERLAHLRVHRSHRRKAIQKGERR